MRHIVSLRGGVKKLKTVQPIRDKKKIIQIGKNLKKKNYRDYFLFVMGTQTGLRISDLLALKVKDVKDKTHITLIEKKTKKAKKFYLNASLIKIIDDYVEGKDDEDFLFPSSKSKGRPIWRQRAYTILKEAAQEVGLEEIGTHTLRKSFGYHFYQQTKDVAMLQDLFNHSAPSITLQYIGINQDLKDKAMEGFNIVDWDEID